MMAVEPPALASSPLASVLVAQYDLSKIYDQVVAIAANLAPVDLNMLAQNQLDQYFSGDEAGGPPVNLKRDLFAQMGAPIVSVSRFDPARKDQVTPPGIVAIGVKNPESLETAISRLHALATGGNKELRREMQGTKIFLIPGGLNFLRLGPGRGPMHDAGMQENAALAVTGNYLVIGPQAAVEQAVRDSHREDLMSIRSDAMFRLAAKYLPSEATMWFYSDGRRAPSISGTASARAAMPPPATRPVKMRRQAARRKSPASTATSGSAFQPTK